MNFTFFKQAFQRKIYELKVVSPKFFDNVYFEDNLLKENIRNWLLNLNQYKNISVPNFPFLFSELKELHLPIKIYGVRGNVSITDDWDNEFILSYSSSNVEEIDKYVIKRKDLKDSFEKSWIFGLTENGEILLEEFKIIQENKNKFKTELNFYYDENSITRAVLKSKTLTLVMIYPSSSYLYDDMISSYLFDISTIFPYIDDLCPILELITNVIKDMKVFGQKYSLEMKSYHGGELLSEICLTNGIVNKYSFSTKGNNLKFSLSEQFPNEKLKDFILKYKKRFN